ncbi:MAG TPA: trigger factor [Candidatus Tumulicola sp.]
MNRLAPTQVELDIPIGADELAAAEERAFRKLVKNVRLPGFRRGKAPRKVFEQAYGPGSITAQAVDEVVPDAYSRALREHQLQPVDHPHMEIVEEVDGRPTRVKATVQVRPEIELQPYSALPVAATPESVTDDEVERSLQALARERGTLVPVDRPAHLGDVVTIDYEGRVGGETFEGGSATNSVVELAEGRFIPGFATGIAGMKAGETKLVAANFPADYTVSDLAGKEAEFTVTLHDVKTLDAPTIDDDFARAVANRSLEDLRTDVRQRLEALATARARRATGSAIVAHLVSTHDVPLPETLVEAEVERLMGDAAAAAAQSGISFAEYLERTSQTEEGLRAQLRTEGESRVKGTLLVEQIAQQENIVATPADLAEELEALSRQYGQPVAKVRKALGNSVVALMDGIVRTKTLDYLIDHAGPAARSGETPSLPS